MAPQGRKPTRPRSRRRRATINSDRPVVDAAIGGLTPHPDNPRTIAPERRAALKRALQAAPEMLRARPVIALTDGRVIAGNQRLLVAGEDLAWKSIPTVFVDLDEPTAKEWALRDNAGYGEWEPQGVAAWLSDLANAGRDLDLTGFARPDVERFLAATSPDDPLPPPPDGQDGYREQYGVVVVCRDEPHQQEVYELLASEGLSPALAGVDVKVVTT